ncbi:HmuY family protein [Sphingobacterium hungaricum]
MKTNNLLSTFFIATTICLASCGRDETPIPEIIPSDGTKLTLDGGAGASDAENAVFVDLSTDKQSSVKRVSWNLGFYNGSNFRVIQNSMTGAAAAVTTSSDINAVNTTNFDISILSSGTVPEKLALYDNPDGDVTKTVISEINATEANNKVYVINTVFAGAATEANIWKVRVLKSGTTGYTLQYAKINETTFKTATIKKDGNNNFQYFSFETGNVTVEPAKTDWDFVWSKAMYTTLMGTTTIPYIFSDLVFTNHLANVSSVQVIFKNTDGTSNGNPTYDEFEESNLAALSLSAARNVIGSNWRATTGTPSGAFTDRFYVIKDASGNVYKLKFLAMGAGSDGGTRGYPQLEYKLVKLG